eukprot:gb/GECG01013000.1/.p1 GENE.gb/GECG01013000.1/~~gb/GECG01013000.1/.p1  ORF type:complete len:242 (+),score=28.11 gb/GECG01013000.1/:1-726(+)
MRENIGYPSCSVAPLFFPLERGFLFFVVSYEESNIIQFQPCLPPTDAVDRRDGYKFDGARLRVEHARRGGGGGFRGGGRGGGPPMRGGRGGFRGGGRGGGPGTRPERGDYRVTVEGLPENTSWQDLKDHFRPAGYVCYTSTSPDGTGVVEFKDKADYEYALDKMDKSECKNRFGATSVIRVDPEKGGGSGGKERSRSRSPSRSRSRSPADKKERSRSRSREGGDDRAPADNGEDRERSPSR